MIVLGVVVLAWVVGIAGGCGGARQVELGVGGGVAVVAVPVVDVQVVEVVVEEEMLLVVRLGGSKVCNVVIGS